jgi:hypothetical protein
MVKAKAKKLTDIVPMMVRMREGLRKKLEASAKKRDHSINFDINHRLADSFADEEHKARDTAIIDMLAGPSTASQGLLRSIIWELQKNPGWADSQLSADLLADAINALVRNRDVDKRHFWPKDFRWEEHIPEEYEREDEE